MDFARQEVTIADLAQKRYATIPAAEYGSRIAAQFPRTPEQKLADLDRVGELALLAVKAGANDKAKAYAGELLAGNPQSGGDGHPANGDGIHDGHVILGLLALRHDDVPAARQQLLEAGNTSGSPWLSGFGPNMLLAKELLAKGERDTVLDYSSCAGSSGSWVGRSWIPGRRRFAREKRRPLAKTCDGATPGNGADRRSYMGRIKGKHLWSKMFPFLLYSPYKIIQENHGRKRESTRVRTDAGTD